MTDLRLNSVLVLIPAYNAALHLPELISRLSQYVCSDNLLIVNDGSTDGTLDIIREQEVNYICFSQNKGKGAALMAGFEHAVKCGYRSVLTLDADLQHLPEEVCRFYAVDDGRHVVVGTRRMSLRNMPFDRWLTNNLTSIIISIFSRARVRDSQSGFRLIPTRLLRAISLKTVDYDFESEMLFKAGALGFGMAEVPITTVYEGSRSYINPFKDTLRFVRQIWKRIWA
ncbi:MAG: glycosyltransferase family 2 protein [Planctomycetota bacterium]